MSRSSFLSILGFVAGAAAAVSALSAAPPAVTPGSEADHASHLPRTTARRTAGRTSGAAKAAEERAMRVADQLAARCEHYWHQGDFESVAFLQRMIVELDPSDVDSWSNLGWVQWSCLNNEAEAEKVLRVGLAANRDRHEMYEELGGYLHRRKRYHEAAAVLAKAVRFPDADDLAWNRYAHALDRMGRPAQAAEVWRKMAARFPGNVHSPVNLDRLKRKGLIPKGSG